MTRSISGTAAPRVLRRAVVSLSGLALAGAYTVVSPGLAGAAEALPDNCVAEGPAVTCTYGFTGGSQSFTVPAGVRAVQVTAVGGTGGRSSNADGGAGARVTGHVDVTAGQVLSVEVGGNGEGATGGYNGGGAGPATDSTYFGGGGGGASDVRTGPGLDTRLIVAGGGGGGGNWHAGGAAGAAGAGSGGGLAGTATAGGGGGGAAAPGEDGALGRGGAGLNHDTISTGLAGGGGGGLYGGGGGGASADDMSAAWYYYGGGGGGSSLVPATGTVTLAPSGTPTKVVITYGAPLCGSLCGLFGSS